MLSEALLIHINKFIKNGFGEEVAQEVSLRLMERSVYGGEEVRDWQNYGFVVALHLRNDTSDHTKRFMSVDGPPGDLAESTPKDALENRRVAHEYLKRVVSSKKGIKVIQYVLQGDRWCSRQRLKQMRDELREELE